MFENISLPQEPKLIFIESYTQEVNMQAFKDRQLKVFPWKLIRLLTTPIVINTTRPTTNEIKDLMAAEVRSDYADVSSEL